MEELSKEIAAMLQLIDDPDEMVFQTVSERFIGYGDKVLIVLEEHYQYAEDPLSKNRLMQIIDNIHVNVLSTSLIEWKKDSDSTILEPSLIISSFIQKGKESNMYLFELEKIRKSIWLELNEFLTPLEVVNIFNKIIFEHFKFQSIQADSKNTDFFSLFELLEMKASNSFPIAALYLIMSEMLGLDLKPVDVLNQNLLCYTEEDNFVSDHLNGQILFFLDPQNGQVYTHGDIENYYKKIGHHYPIEQIKPTGNNDFLSRWLINYSKNLDKNSWMQDQVRLIAQQL